MLYALKLIKFITHIQSVTDIFEKYIYKEDMSPKKRGMIALLLLWGLALAMMPATHYTEASHLMGVFLAGLVFCTDHDLHVEFVSQNKRCLQVSRYF